MRRVWSSCFVFCLLHGQQTFTLFTPNLHCTKQNCLDLEQHTCSLSLSCTYTHTHTRALRVPLLMYPTPELMPKVVLTLLCLQAQRGGVIGLLWVIKCSYPAQYLDNAAIRKKSSLNKIITSTITRYWSYLQIPTAAKHTTHKIYSKDKKALRIMITIHGW